MVEEGEGGKKKTERTSKRFGRVRKREEEEEEKGKGPFFPIHTYTVAHAHQTLQQY